RPAAMVRCPGSTTTPRAGSTTGVATGSTWTMTTATTSRAGSTSTAPAGPRSVAEAGPTIAAGRCTTRTVASSAAPARRPPSGPVVRVAKVIDGDTIEVSGPVTGQVEIIGISAPRSDKDQCGASASTAFASRTLAGTNVTLVTDPSQPATDRSGRRLASVRT